MARIGIFGGSFNPPHRGHLLAVSEFQKRLQLDRVLLVPAAMPPHKALTSGSPDAGTRLELTRLAAAPLPFAEVSDIELRREGTSYTADTLELLQAQYPGDTLYLLMGTDMFLSFDHWSRPKQIARAAMLAVAHRDADDAGELKECAKALKHRYHAQIRLVENAFLPYSSTVTRRCSPLAAGRNTSRRRSMRKFAAGACTIWGRTCAACPSAVWRKSVSACTIPSGSPM